MSMLNSSLEAGIVMLREGIEVALIIGVLLAYLRRTGRGAYVPHVIWALATAGLASVAVALLLRRSGVATEDKVFEGGLMLAAAALVASLVVWMLRVGREARSRLERGLERFAGETAAAPTRARVAVGVFLFAFVMVLREGVETALFMTALATAAGAHLTAHLAGGATGLLLAVIFGLLLVRGSLRVNLRRFFAVTGAVLLVLVVKLVAGGLHEFAEAGLLSPTPFWEDVLEVFTHRTASLAILVVLALAPAACAAWDWWRKTPRRQAATDLPQQPNGAHS